jgi:SAM-dependent methyltransferase
LRWLPAGGGPNTRPPTPGDQRGCRPLEKNTGVKTKTIQRQYDEVIAHHYDFDPQSVIRSSLDRAAGQIRRSRLLGDAVDRLRVLDLGVGTGLFLARLKDLGGERVVPFGLDISEKMIDRARRRVPDLDAAVDDAANLDAHFPGQSFDLVCTHFVTGFVPMAVLAPKIAARLDEGGYWSFVGGTRAGFPTLQAKADSRLLRLLGGGRPLAVGDLACNPTGRDEVVRTLHDHGFAVRDSETFQPDLVFRDFGQFMEFAHRGGWLTPFIEAYGLHQAGRLTRLLLNLFLFPVHDRHSIEIVLAQKVGS